MAKKRKPCSLRMKIRTVVCWQHVLLRSWHSTSGSALLLATALVSLGSAVVDGLTDGMISAESTEATAAKLQSLCQTGRSIGPNENETLSKTKRNNPKQLFHVIFKLFHSFVSGGR